MNPTKLSSSLVDKLKTEQITPKPKWEFVLQSLLLGAGIILFLIIGVLAAAVVTIFITEMHLFQIFGVRVGYGLKALLVGFPMFWFIMLIGLGVLVSFFAYKTETGHRHSLIWWVGAIILTQMIGGVVLAYSPLGDYVERGMEHQIWRSQNLNRHRDQFWARSEDGRLSGQIMEIQYCEVEKLVTERNQGICAVVIKSRKEIFWTVHTVNTDFKRLRMIPNLGMRIRFIGEKIDSENFTAFNVVSERRSRGGYNGSYFDNSDRLYDGRRRGSRSRRK